MRHLFFSLCCVCLLVGCHSQSSDNPLPSSGRSYLVRPYGALSNPLPKQRDHCARLSPERIVSLLGSRGIQVVKVGATIQIELPAKQLFHGNTPNLRQFSYSTLGCVADYIKQFDTVSVHVSGHNHTQKTPVENFALSADQASAIARYLWTQDLGTRMVLANGYSDCLPIVGNKNAGRIDALNNYIQIITRIRDF